jgi:hypothetical protein
MRTINTKTGDSFGGYISIQTTVRTYQRVFKGFRNKKLEDQEEEATSDDGPVVIDFSWIEFVAMTKLGYSLIESKHIYYCEFVEKYRLYKKLFNLEKMSVYQIGKPQIDSLRSL